MGFVMVPTPGPNSTNTSARPQFTGARIFSIRKREDGITEPTITGFFRNPRANMVRGPGRRRSEEHTSELQSLMRISYAVFCLKKKKNNKSDKSEIPNKYHNE